MTKLVFSWDGEQDKDVLHSHHNNILMKSLDHYKLELLNTNV